VPRQLSRTRQGAEVYPPRRSSQKKSTLWSFRGLVISVHWSACAKRNFPVELVRKGHVETLSVAFQGRMVGSGVVWLELIKDVAFRVPPIGPTKARDMIAWTRFSKLLE
jgi:hypothetical protein